MDTLSGIAIGQTRLEVAVTAVHNCRLQLFDNTN